jgi:coenzyme Q-binding protein COQ10
MPKHRELRRLPWSAAEMFDLVADIGRYGEFLPWVQGMRVGPVQAQPDGKAVVVADMIVGFRMIREKFTSRVTLERVTAEGLGHIHVDYLDGPMKHLFNDWRFRDHPDGGCEIDFSVDFEFRNKAFETLAGLFFTQAFEKMVGAFVARAEQLYGPR